MWNILNTYQTFCLYKSFEKTDVYVYVYVWLCISTCLFWRIAGGGTMLTCRSCRSIVRRRQNSPRDFNRIVPTILQDSQDSPGSNSSWDSSQWAPMSLRCQSFQGVGGVNLGSFCHWWYFFFHQQTQMTAKKKKCEQWLKFQSRPGKKYFRRPSKQIWQNILKLF